MNWSFTDVGEAVGPNIHAPVILIGDQFERTRVRLDGNYFVGNDFRNCILFYGDGEVGLDSTNSVSDSVLIILGTVDRNSRELEQLLRGFHWLDVRYEETEPMKGSPRPQ
jgi:hypothetical protein